MSKYVIGGETLTGIADAIRAKTGSEERYTPESMAVAIEAMPSGDTGVENSIVDRSISGNYENDEVLTVGEYAFASCLNLISVHFKSVTDLRNYSFRGSYALKSAIFESLSKITYYVFEGCRALETVVILSEKIATLVATSSFQNTPIASGTGFVYVPDDLVEQYKVATNWATYADQIKPLSELPGEVQEWLSPQNP